MTPDVITDRLRAALATAGLADTGPAGRGLARDRAGGAVMLDAETTQDMVTVTVPAAGLGGRAGLRPGRAGL